MHKKPRVLFVLKFRQTSGGGSYAVIKSSGLLNSAGFVSDMLNTNGYDTKLVQVIDNNQIDREVTLYKPDIVIIEALWVVPEKFDVLRALHPNVKWVIRIHSKIPFLAGEGIAMNWITRYFEQKNVFVSFNSLETHCDFLAYINQSSKLRKYIKKLVYLPNYYPVADIVTPSKLFWNHDEIINVGCFGAVRPMKNHLTQAFAAVKFADQRGLQCHFHINAGRVEKGDEVLKNLRGFFEGLGPRHKLVEHGWLDHKDFLALVAKMDIGLQVSMSETFNIVAADFVSQDTPIVTSREIDWMPRFFTTDITSVDSIVRAIGRVLWYDRHLIWLDVQRRALKRYTKLSKRAWLDNLRHVC